MTTRQPTILRNLTDTMVNESNPTKPYPGVRRLYIGTNAGDTRYPHVYFSLPFKRGVKITDAKLHFFNDAAWAGSVTVTGKPLSSKWFQSTLNWNNKPAVGAGTASVNKTDAAANTEWVMDITSIMQTVSNGSAWWGLRLDATGSAIKKIYSVEAATGLRPYVEITWSDKPLPPTDMTPGDGGVISMQYPVFQCDFTDFSGATDMAAMNVRVFATQANADANSSWEWDSGNVTKTVPELWTDPADPNYVSMEAWSGITNGNTRWWRVRVQDSAGEWSGWSDPESFTRTNKGTLVIDNPAASPNNFVWESTPPFDWTHTPAASETQKHYQLIVQDVVTGTWVWTTGKVTGIESIRTPEKPILRDDKTYKFICRVWDSVAGRIKTANETVYLEASRNFTVNFDATTNPVTNLAVIDQYPYPWAKVTWDRATMPDRYDIYRDNKVIEQGLGTDFFVSGTSYEFIDRLAAPYVQHTYKVVAIANNKGSASNPTASVTPRSVAPFLSLEDGTNGVFIFNPKVDAQEAQVQEIVEFVSDAPPILVTAARRGFEGSITGVLSNADVISQTARQQRDRFVALRNQPGRSLRLVFLDEAIECFIYNAVYEPKKDMEGIYYDVSFQFVQVDY